MNRAETKIIIWITEILHQAADSEEKTELIEELSENLFQRYRELIGEGMPEEEALEKAKGGLGDTRELIEYLNSVAKDRAVQESRSREESWQGGEEDQPRREGGSQKNRWNFDLDLDGLGESIDNLTEMAVQAAKSAVNFAKDMTKKHGATFSWQMERDLNRQTEIYDTMGMGISRIDAQLTSGNLICYSRGEGEEIRIEYDPEGVEISEEGDTLRVRQNPSASSSLLFSRGLLPMEVKLFLPKRRYEILSLKTRDGDICIYRGLEARELKAETVSGDIEISGADADYLMLETISGDVEGRGLQGNLRAESKSGDIEIEGYFGQCMAANISGDVDLELTGLPRRTKVSTISGDTALKLPGDEGFTLFFQSVSGDLETDMDFDFAETGEKRKRKLSYLGGGDKLIQVSSTSGDAEIEKLSR